MLSPDPGTRLAFVIALLFRFCALLSVFFYFAFSYFQVGMATVAAPMYSTHHHSFLQQSSRAATSVQVQQPALQQQDLLEDQFTTLFCRAIYDYEAQDASALSFRKDDIIEVLTQQPSGWWDGLLGDERGWFPSNYVKVISDEEAELAFSGSEFASTESTVIENNGASMVDMSHAILRGSSQAENEQWLDNEVSFRNDSHVNSTSSANGPTQLSDFWMPQVTPDGQVSALRACVYLTDL